MRVKGAAYGDDLRCLAEERAETVECLNISSRVFYFFGLTASPLKMWVRRLVFGEGGVMLEVEGDQKVMYLDRETGVWTDIQVGDGEMVCK